jgi:hypothetical protein
MIGVAGAICLWFEGLRARADCEGQGLEYLKEIRFARSG